MTRLRTAIRAGLLAVLAALVPGICGAFSLVSEGEPEAPPQVKVSADRVTYNRQQDRVEAEGNVVVTRDGARLLADRLVWERATGLLRGEGNIRAEDGPHRLSAQAIVWRMADATGEMVDARLSLNGRYHLNGGLVMRTGPDRYLVKHGDFSTCPCEAGRRRPWSVAASRLSARVGGTLVARSVRFRVKEVPVLYFPVFFFPTSNRQTGLLLPNFGSDTRNGFRYVQPFYWVISPSQDLTVTYDLRSRRGNGGELWYRYMTSPRSRGDVRVEGIADRETDETMGRLRWNHVTRKVSGWNWYADVDTVNDRDYLRVTGDATQARTVDRLESHLSASRVSAGAGASVLVRKTTNLLAAGDTTVQQLPRLRLEGFDRHLGPLPLWVGGVADSAYLYRETGPRALRTDVAPALTLQVPLPGQRVTAVGRAGARLIWYSTSNAGYALTEAYPVTASLSTRVRGRLFGWTHVLVPEVQYRHVAVNLGGAPAFDSLEQLKREHQAAFRLRQRLGRLGWIVTVPYDLDTNRGLAVRSRLETTAWGLGWLHVDSYHGPHSPEVRRLMADWVVQGRVGSLSLGEVYDRGEVGVGTPFWSDTPTGFASGVRSHFQTASASLGPVKGWRITGNAFYDARDRRPVETRYGIAYQGSCWSLEVSYADFPDRNLVRFRVSLTGDEEDFSAAPAGFAGLP